MLQFHAIQVPAANVAAEINTYLQRNDGHGWSVSSAVPVPVQKIGGVDSQMLVIFQREDPLPRETDEVPTILSGAYQVTLKSSGGGPWRAFGPAVMTLTAATEIVQLLDKMWEVHARFPGGALKETGWEGALAIYEGCDIYVFDYRGPAFALDPERPLVGDACWEPV